MDASVFDPYVRLAMSDSTRPEARHPPPTRGAEDDSFTRVVSHHSPSAETRNISQESEHGNNTNRDTSERRETSLKLRPQGKGTFSTTFTNTKTNKGADSSSLCPLGPTRNRYLARYFLPSEKYLLVLHLGLVLFSPRFTSCLWSFNLPSGSTFPSFSILTLRGGFTSIFSLTCCYTFPQSLHL